MTYRAIFFNILFGMLCCIYSPTISMQKTPQMSPMDFEAELEEANRAIEEYVASLPPAEQEEFNRQVEDMAKMFENMSEDDFEKFLGEMFTDEQMMEPNPFETSQPEIQETVEVTLSADDKKKVETAVKVLDDIINQTNLFLVIINSSPELPNRIDRWATKGTIANWQAGTNWNTFKAELEVFVQKLYKTLEQDLTTKKYKYLFDLIADEALYNNLIQLQTELNVLVPTINIPEFSVQKLSAESKVAINDILNKYTESFYLLTIPKGLDAFFEKYAPEAEKIRIAEEAANKKALEAHKGTRTPAPKTEAGVESEEGYDYGYDSYGGYDNYNYNPYGGYSGYGDRDYSPYGGSDYGGGFSNRSGGGAGGGSSGSAGGGAGASGGKEGKEDKEKEDKKKKAKAEFKPNLKVERAIADIKSGLEEITAAMTSEETTNVPTKLADLKGTIAIEKPEIDIIFAGSTLPMVDKKLSIIDKAIKTITEATNADNIDRYQGEIRDMFKKHDKELTSLRDDIDKNFEEKTEEEKEAAAKKAPAGESTSTKIDVSDLSPEQQWAYFGKETLSSNAENDKLKEQITTPTSLFDIKEKIDTLKKDVEKFMNKKAVVKQKEAEPVMPELDLNVE